MQHQCCEHSAGHKEQEPNTPKDVVVRAEKKQGSSQSSSSLRTFGAGTLKLRRHSSMRSRGGKVSWEETGTA